MNINGSNDRPAECRTDLGVRPGDSDSTRMLAIALLVVAGVVLLGLAFAVTEGWLW